MSSLVRARRTTVLTAFFRALESNKPARERLFTDPYAKVFLTPLLKMWAFLSVYPFFKWAIPKYINYFWPGAHTAIVARTRLIDVMTIRAIQDHGVNQVMILDQDLIPVHTGCSCGKGCSLWKWTGRLHRNINNSC